MEKRLLKYGVLCVILILGVILFVYFRIFHYGFSTRPEDYSHFGDYVGGSIGAIMALVSAILIYLTYRQQIVFSREQMALSRKSQFENNLFSLLATQREIVSMLSFDHRDPMNPSKTKLHVGTEAIRRASDDIKNAMLEFGFDTDETNKMSFPDLRVKIDALFCNALGSYGESSFGHYFRHLYHLIKFIDDSEISEKNKYVSLIQSQMSNEELYLLFFNALSNYGYPKLYRLVSKYSLVENLYYHDFDYFKILQRKCYPNIFFKQTPNNAIFVVGYFSKLRETLMIEISKELEMVLVDVDGINYGTNNNYRLRIIGQGKRIVHNISDIIEEGKNYLFNGSLIETQSRKTIQEIADHMMVELRPRAIIICIDSIEDIVSSFTEDQKLIYRHDEIDHIIQIEQECTQFLCEQYNIPLLECRSTEKERMISFISTTLNF